MSNEYQMEREAMWPTISEVESVQDRYEGMRASGESHSMAEMLATRSFPGVKGTDSVFMEGRQLDGAQFANLPGELGRNYLKQAAAAGVNPAGKYYMGGLAEFVGDPRAWVSGLGDVKRVAEERGLEVTGAINVAAPKYADGWVEPKNYKVDESLVAERVRSMVEANPELATTKRDELKYDIGKQMAGVRG